MFLIKEFTTKSNNMNLKHSLKFWVWIGTRWMTLKLLNMSNPFPQLRDPFWKVQQNYLINFGLSSPFTVNLKMWFQKLYANKTKWDLHLDAEEVETTTQWIWSTNQERHSQILFHEWKEATLSTTAWFQWCFWQSHSHNCIHAHYILRRRYWSLPCCIQD